MKLKLSSFALAALASFPVLGANEATVTLLPSEESPIIAKEIYGQFAEHLGTCIYGGLWVGENSPIPNTNGYRTDVLNALKELKIPVLRWPGGCFADEYHWMDGIGPKENRPRMVNTNWGGTVEDNSFGTHDFFNLCEMLGCEPYLSGNVGSGTVEELAKWVEYITAEEGPMANLRRQNGREKPWKLKYLGVGNESWGCGGNFRPEYYADVYRRYQTYCRNFNGNRLYKIASGASDYDYNWTEVLMKNARNHMDGISLHYYTVTGWSGRKGSAIDFDSEDYYWTLGKCLEIKDVVKRHCDIMDKYDPKKRIGLLVDEWGTWWDEEPGKIRPSISAEHNARRHGRGSQSQHFPPLHRPRENDKYRANRKRAAVYGAHKRRQDGSYSDILSLQDVCATSGCKTASSQCGDSHDSRPRWTNGACGRCHSFRKRRKDNHITREYRSE